VEDIRNCMIRPQKDVQAIEWDINLQLVLNILSNESESIRGHWSSVLLRTREQEGILSLLSASDLVIQRKAFECCITILKSGVDMKMFSEARPVSNGNWRAFSFVEDYRSSCLALFDAVLELIARNHPDDVVLLDEFINRFVKVFPWTSNLLNKNQQLSKRLVVQLCASRNVSSSIMMALADLVRQVPSGSIDIDQIRFFALHLRSYDSRKRSCMIAAFNYLLSKLPGRDMDVCSDLASFVEEGILQFQIDSQMQNAACFINLALLDNLSMEVLECLKTHLTQPIIEKHVVESILYGVGKASRRNSDNVSSVCRILTPQIAERFSESCNPASIIQCMGDVVFSGVLLVSNSLENQRGLLSILESKLSRKQEAPVVLRAFMTGYSRVIESKTVCNTALAREIDAILRCFVEHKIVDAISDPEMNERFVADLMRSVGLIETAGFGEWLDGEIIDKALRDATTSSKTQIVVGSLVSLRVRKSPIGEVISKIIDANVSGLESRRTWDYNSAPVVSGCLHILVEAVRTSAATDPSIVNVRREGIRVLLDFIRCKRIDQYNESIPKHCDTLSSLIEKDC
jgi:hypothetical protein